MKSRAYLFDVSGSGPSGRNRLGLRNVNGVTWASLASTSCGSVGSVGQPALGSNSPGGGGIELH